MNVFRYYVEFDDGGMSKFVLWPMDDPPLDAVTPVTMTCEEFEDFMMSGVVMIPAPAYIAAVVRERIGDQSS